MPPPPLCCSSCRPSSAHWPRPRPSATERGRRPFRPPADWNRRLGLLAYGIYLLADQTGADIEAEVRAVAQATKASAANRRPDGEWPFTPR